MKNSKVLILALALVLVSTAAWAQGRIEIMPFAGYRTTGSFEGAVLDFTDFHIKDGFAYGLTFGYRVNQMFTIEGMWSRVDSSISAMENASEVELAKLSTDQFHGNFLIFFGGEEMKARPYFLIGLGATIANPKSTTFDGETVDPGSESRFSWSLGGGLQVMFSEKVGLRAQGKWTPTYINTSSEIWVDWWGYPWVVPVSNYMNQWEFTGGLVFRF
jgi:opacity protein-like surface antigen